MYCQKCEKEIIVTDDAYLSDCPFCKPTKNQADNTTSNHFVVIKRLMPHLGLANTQGQMLTPIKYNEIYKWKEGIVCVKLNGNYGLIDKDGKEITPLHYEDKISFSEELARVKLNGKCGFIDKQGKEVIPLVYDDAEYGFKDGYTTVTLNKRSFYINTLGKEFSFD